MENDGRYKAVVSTEDIQKLCEDSLFIVVSFKPLEDSNPAGRGNLGVYDNLADLDNVVSLLYATIELLVKGQEDIRTFKSYTC